MNNKQRPFTLPELAILNEYRCESIDFLYDDRRESHDVILPMHGWSHPTKAQHAALVKLVKRGVLARRSGYYVVTAAAYEAVYGTSFEYAFTRALQRHYDNLIDSARETRQHLQAIRWGNVSQWELNAAYETYTDSLYRDLVNLDNANWQAYASGDRRALLFHHHVADAYTNGERYLQSIEQLISSVEVRGAVKTAMRYGVNFQAA